MLLMEGFHELTVLQEEYRKRAERGTHREHAFDKQKNVPKKLGIKDFKKMTVQEYEAYLRCKHF
jgi:hypothetical protein